MVSEASPINRIVRPSMLRKLKLHDKTQVALAGEGIRSRGTIWGRFIARRTAAAILNDECCSYQFGGIQGPLSPEYLLIDADKHQLAHWVLYQAGYSCCCADLMEMTGTPEV